MASPGTPQPMSEQSGVSGVPGSTGPDPTAMFRAWAQSQTQLGPNMAHTQQQVSPQQQAPTTARGGKAAAVQNLGATIQNVLGKVTQAVQQRKAKEQDQVFGRFTNSVSGIQAAQAQLEEAQQANQQALKAFQSATTPEAKQSAQAQMKAAAEKVRTAQQAMEVNRGILDNDFNPVDPKGQRNIKILQKGFGIDDKNKDTPERQAAIRAMQKTMGVGPGAAGIMSQLPQTQQPVPGQQQIKPPTGGQMLSAQTQTRGQDLRQRESQAALLSKQGISDGYIQLRASKEGQVAEAHRDGDVTTWTFRPMTDQEKAISGAAAQGKIAWTMKDGKPVSVLRNPTTNQIIPGSENPALLPPAYLTEHVHEGNYFWTDPDGNIHQAPVTSTTKPALPGSHTVTPLPRMTPQSSGGDKIIGKGKTPPVQNELRMNFEKNYEKPAEDVERSAQMANVAYKQYKDAAAKGETLPSGAQAMVELSSHIQSTFGSVKGARITKDMIAHHLGARSISDDARVAFQKLNDGDPLSPSQWEAFNSLINESRKEQWTIAAKEAKRAKAPMDFVPQDLLKQGVGAPEGFKPGRDGAYVGSDNRTVVGWMIDGKYVEEK